MTNENTPLLELRDVTIQYRTDDGVAKAVNHVSFQLNRGETLGLVGETGAGKTTTALGIMGLLPVPPARITGGEILYNGEDLLKKKEKELCKIRGNQITMIFQDPMTSLNPVTSTGEQIMEVIRLHQKCSRTEAMAKAKEMFRMVGIPPERVTDYPHEFSGGMKQRIMIAMALACNPSLLIADEPTTTLDVTIQAQILELMRDLKEKLNTAMVLITHDLGVVAEICDRVAIMYAGEVVEIGSVEQIYDETAHPYTQALFQSLPDLEHNTRRLQAIEGMMPNPMELPDGCKFYSRCKSASDKCRQVEPEMQEITPGHLCRCLLCIGNDDQAERRG